MLTKSREMLTTADALLQEDACPYTAVQTVDTLPQLNFDLLKHLPYSPDLASLDYQVFGSL
jgi:hypothetical protein